MTYAERDGSTLYVQSFSHAVRESSQYSPPIGGVRGGIIFQNNTELARQSCGHCERQRESAEAEGQNKSFCP